MNEELIISGRENLGVDPQLHIWHWPIPLYLFLGGLAAGVLFFAALYYLLGKEKEFRTAVRTRPVCCTLCPGYRPCRPLLSTSGTRLTSGSFTLHIRLESPMSWGAWTLLVITTASFIWCALHIREFFPNWDWKYSWLKDLEIFFNKHKKPLAWVIMIFAVITGVYTGILLSAFNARPLWNTSVLGPLFLASGLSAGAATIVLSSRNRKERLLFTKIDLIILGVELFLIVHMFMGFLASTQVQIEAAGLFLGGPYTMVFWIFVVVLGIIIPAVLDLMELQGISYPRRDTRDSGSVRKPYVQIYFCFCRTGQPVVILIINKKHNNMSNNTKTGKSRKYLNPYLGGVLLGLVLLAANFVAGRGLGASGAVKSVVATTIRAVDKDAVNTNPFMAEYAESHSGSPMKSWLVFEMLGVLVGGFLSGAVAGRLKLKVEHSPKITSRRRLIFALAGGVLFGFGSQLGRGCTSGSALSGMAVLSMGGFITMMAIFGTAYALAYFFRRNWI